MRTSDLRIILGLLAGACTTEDQDLPDKVTFDTRWGAVERPYRLDGDDVVVEGDIIVGSVDEVFGPALRSAGRSKAWRRWPNGRIPFEKDPALTNTQSNDVDGAIAYWEAHTRIDFVAKGANDTDFVEFTTGSDFCSSDIGMTGGLQKIKLEPGHCNEGTIIHEIGHAVGMYHEQNRADRDDFVTIHWDCIDPGKVGNYQKYADLAGRDLGAYDFDSVMHYEDDTFYSNEPNCVGNKTMERIDGQNLNPSSHDLSDGDLLGVELLYGRRNLPDLDGKTGARFGAACATGDFDGDGHDDLIVGAPQQPDGNISEEGAADVYQGIDHDRRVTAWHELNDPYAPAYSGRFGKSLAVADFDDDGRDDVVIGAPHTDYSGIDEAGQVYIFRGGEDGMTWWSAFNNPMIGGGPSEVGAKLAWSLAVGDFDGDGVEELAIGSPGERNALGFATGVVHIVDVDPLTGYTSGWAHLMPLGSVAQEFGDALAVGDFNDDGYDDLAVGAPSRTQWTGAAWVESGGVSIYLGSPAGMTFDRALDQSGVSPEEDGDRFGTALAAGDLDHSGPDDLAVGAPGESVNGHPGAGRVYFYEDAGAGLVYADYLDGDSATVLAFEPNGTEDGDAFGYAFTTGALPYGGSLGIGAPGDGDGLRPGRAYTVATFFGNYGATGMYREAPLTIEQDGDRFGAAMCAGDFADTGVDDLVVGATYGQANPLDVFLPLDIGTAFIIPNLNLDVTNVVWR